jgi:cytoskeletal protein RodZ
VADVSRSERPLKEQQRIMFGSPLARVALIVGLAVGALGLALAVGASAAYLVSPSYDERSADQRPPVVSLATQTQDGAAPAAPAARDARDAGAMTAPQAKPGERDDGVGRPPSSSASTTPSASTTASASATPSASATASASAAAVREAAVHEAAVRDNDPPSGPSARSADGVGTPASTTPSASATAPAKPSSTTWWSWRSGSGG